MSDLKELEKEVIIFLNSYAKNEHVKEVVVPHLAHTSLMMNHLYEDLGFKNRKEMGDFMSEHFPSLAILKPEDKLWKKFIYDSIGRVAPACESCPDQIDCFVCKI
jgi:nitrogen fixation protein NifQ